MVAAFSLASLAEAQRPGRAAPAPASAAPAERLVLTLSEGSDGVPEGTDVMSRYDELAALIGRAMNRRVVFYAVRDAGALESGLRDGRLDIVIARLAEHAARGVRDYKYQLVAVARGEGFVMGIVPADSPLRSIEDVRGKRIAVPPENDYTSRMALALLRDIGVKAREETSVSFHRDQAVIGHALGHNLVDVGFVSSSSAIGRAWQKQGGRVLVRGPKQPTMPVVVGPKVTALELQQLRNALVGLDRTAEGRVLLSRLGVAGFEERDPADLAKLLKWLDQ
ncbi:MAG: PhnD/SsuA/transferrin family substrate-binding protein [Burkholderiales bacterium]